MLKIGFMQGRLSPKPADRIQAFPKDSWREEFAHASELKFDCIELIHDDLYLEQNPLDSSSGRRELKEISAQSGVALTSICGDYFMIHKLADRDASNRKRNYEKAIELFEISAEVGCPLVEFPFVDSSSVKNPDDLRMVTEIVQSLAPEAEKRGLRIAMETDLPPVEFRDFLNKLPKNVGANLDLGNSAALGYDALAECRAYGSRVYNVHIKDRMLGGTTVPLTTGHTDFGRAFKGLAEAGYREDFILQTAPSPDYLGAALKYQQMVREWITLL